MGLADVFKSFLFAPRFEYRHDETDLHDASQFVLVTLAKQAYRFLVSFVVLCLVSKPHILGQSGCRAWRYVEVKYHAVKIEYFFDKNNFAHSQRVIEKVQK